MTAHTGGGPRDFLDIALRFEEWWTREGRWIDPDTSDVPWFDKRKELCQFAFNAAFAQSRNYVADREVRPTVVTLANGRVVKAVGGGFLDVETTQ